jgi:hypothetical protein
VSLSGPSSTRVIHRSASESSLRHPRPIRHIPSASRLAQNHPPSLKQPQQLGYHQRSISAGATPYPQYPSAAAVAAQYRLPPSQRIDYSSALFRNSAKALHAPSAWSALHPPTHHFRHTKSTSSLRTLAESNGSTASFATFRQLPQAPNPYLSHMHARRARTAGSASSYSSRSGGGHGVPAVAQSWTGPYQRGMTFASSRSSTPLHRMTSSHSSSSGSASGPGGKGSLTSEVLKEVDEEALGSGNNTPATSAFATATPGRSRSPTHGASRSTSRSPPASRSASSSRQRPQQRRDHSSSRSRSPSLSRSVTPSNIIESYMYRSGTPVISHTAPGGQTVQSRVGSEGEIRRLRSSKSDVDLSEGTMRKYSRGGSRKGKGKHVIVHF